MLEVEFSRTLANAGHLERVAFDTWHQNLDYRKLQFRYAQINPQQITEASSAHLFSHQAKVIGNRG